MIRTSLRTAEPGVGAAAPAGSGREPGPGPEPVRGRLPRGHSALPPGRRQSARYARLASDSRITVAEVIPAVSPMAATSTSATLTCITRRSGPINSIERSRLPTAPELATWVLLIRRRMLCSSQWVIPGMAGGNGMAGRPAGSRRQPVFGRLSASGEKWSAVTAAGGHACWCDTAGSGVQAPRLTGAAAANADNHGHSRSVGR